MLPIDLTAIWQVRRCEKVPAIQCENMPTDKISLTLILIQQQQSQGGWQVYRHGQVSENVIFITTKIMQGSTVQKDYQKACSSYIRDLRT